MLVNIIKHTHLVIIILLAACLNVYAGDLDDGIEIDDKIEKYDTLDRPGINIDYIKRSAKASAARGGNSYIGSGDVAIGGFINQPGAEVGDVTIIFDGEDINAISE
jgi:hypothetical protein